MPKIMIGDKDLNDCSPAEAFLAGAHPGRAIFEGGDRLDYHRNGTLLESFGDREQMGVDLAIARYMSITGGGYSAQFNSLRAGELMNWATRHGIVEQVEGPAWRLMLREYQFELVGPETHQRAARVRGLTGAEAVIAAKLWDRELKRREKARVKRVARIIDEARREIRYIGKHEPELKLGAELAQFAVGDVDTVVGAEDFILDSMLPLSVRDANVIATAVSHLYIDVCARQTEKAAAARRAAREAEEAAALAALADFRLANPPPPPRVAMAEVEWLPRSNARADHRCTITGTQAGVEAESEYLRDRWQGYSMGVDPAVEIEPGVWQAKGGHWNSCD